MATQPSQPGHCWLQFLNSIVRTLGSKCNAKSRKSKCLCYFNWWCSVVTPDCHTRITAWRELGKNCPFIIVHGLSMDSSRTYLDRGCYPIAVYHIIFPIFPNIYQMFPNQYLSKLVYKSNNYDLCEISIVNWITIHSFNWGTLRAPNAPNATIG